jgi:hypothetical protein
MRNRSSFTTIREQTIGRVVAAEERLPRVARQIFPDALIVKRKVPPKPEMKAEDAR